MHELMRFSLCLLLSSRFFGVINAEIFCFSVPFGTLEVQDVTNKSQCLKVWWVTQMDISDKIK